MQDFIWDSAKDDQLFEAHLLHNELDVSFWNDVANHMGLCSEQSSICKRRWEWISKGSDKQTWEPDKVSCVNGVNFPAAQSLQQIIDENVSMVTLFSSKKSIDSKPHQSVFPLSPFRGQINTINYKICNIVSPQLLSSQPFYFTTLPTTIQPMPSWRPPRLVLSGQFSAEETEILLIATSRKLSFSVMSGILDRFPLDCETQCGLLSTLPKQSMPKKNEIIKFAPEQIRQLIKMCDIWSTWTEISFQLHRSEVDCRSEWLKFVRMAIGCHNKSFRFSPRLKYLHDLAWPLQPAQQLVPILPQSVTVVAQSVTSSQRHDQLPEQDVLWTDEMTTKLSDAFCHKYYQKVSPVRWKFIARDVGCNVTPAQCESKCKSLLKVLEQSGYKTGDWTSAEDNSLETMIRLHTALDVMILRLTRSADDILLRVKSNAHSQTNVIHEPVILQSEQTLAHLWTHAMITKLIDGSELFPGMEDRWNSVAHHMGHGLTSLQCEAKWNLIYHKLKFKRTPWTDKEKQALLTMRDDGVVFELIGYRLTRALQDCIAVYKQLTNVLDSKPAVQTSTDILAAHISAQWINTVDTTNTSNNNNSMQQQYQRSVLAAQISAQWTNTTRSLQEVNSTPRNITTTTSLSDVRSVVPEYWTKQKLNKLHEGIKLFTEPVGRWAFIARHVGNGYTARECEIKWTKLNHQQASSIARSKALPQSKAPPSRTTLASIITSPIQNSSMQLFADDITKQWAYPNDCNDKIAKVVKTRRSRESGIKYKRISTQHAVKKRRRYTNQVRPDNITNENITETEFEEFHSVQDIHDIDSDDLQSLSDAEEVGSDSSGFESECEDWQSSNVHNGQDHDDIDSDCSLETAGDYGDADSEWEHD